MQAGGLAIELRHAGRLCYAMQQGAVPWLHAVVLQNRGPEPLDDVAVRIELEPGLAAPFVVHAARVPAGMAIDLGRLDPPLDAGALANLHERQRATLRATASHGGRDLAQASAAIEVLAYNEWPGLQPLPALLAAFVSPNHPALQPLVREVSERLRQATGDGALHGYAAGGDRPRAVLGAIHAALAARGIAYAKSPPSFEQQGQKVRMPEQLLADRLGNCLDLTLVYAALLEHAGLHPLVVLQRDHAFVGVWLQPGSCAEVLCGPAVELRKRVDLGALLVLECTAACAGEPADVAAALAAARAHLDADAAFAAAIDVDAARRAGIAPLPPRLVLYATAAPDDAPDTAPAAAPAPDPAVAPGRAAAPVAPAAPPPPAPPPPKDRLEHWRSRLLDLSLWNRLLNFAPTKRTIPLSAHDLAALEDKLQQGGRVRVHPRPRLDGDGARDLALQQQRTGRDLRQDYLAEELRHGRLRAELDPDDLDARAVEVFRHARTSLEESGANTLYLALGFLKWFESPQSDKPRRAPLLLLPLLAERASVQDGVRFALDDAEPRVNQTLLQLLQRDHGVRVPLDEALPEDERGVDVAAVLDAFRAAVVGLPRWEVETSACIGFFAFTKHLMWLDLAARDELLQSPVLRHLVERPGQAFAQEVPELPRDELDELDPAAVFCPKDADSSQLAAVLAGAAGRTFVLEGPPGTGKSQTITNLIAQALANGKRVLFVAEKRAALEVVQRRLGEVGLGPFCLELHSTKSGPKAVLEQLRRALELGQRREPAEWRDLAAALQQQRRQLNAFVQALHRRRPGGGSVFEAMARLCALRAAPRLPLPALAAVPPERGPELRAAVAALAAAAAPLGVPAREPWWGVRRREFAPALLREVAPLAERLQAAAGRCGAALQAFAQRLGLPAEPAPSRAGAAALLALAGRLAERPLPPGAWLAPADWPARAAALRALLALGERRAAAWQPLAARWRPELLALDLAGLGAAFAQHAQAFAPLRWWRLRGPRAALAPVALVPPGAAAAVAADLAAAAAVAALDRELAAAVAAVPPLGAAWRGAGTDWAQLRGWLDHVEAVRGLLAAAVPGAVPGAAPPPAALAATAALLDALAAGDAAAAQLLAELRQAHDAFAAALQPVAQLLDLDPAAAFGGDAAPDHAGAVAARAAAWLGALPRLREHCGYAAAAAVAARLGLGPLVDAHATGALATDQLLPAFDRTWTEDWLDAIHRQEPALARFHGLAHERAIAQFVELDRRAIALCAEVVVARLAAQLPQLRATAVASSELGLLERELKKQRRHKPLRRLFAEIPGLLGKLAPCVLTSPLSTVQFLSRRQPFDLVVFDEASQIPVWDAVGAIGRGRSLVVVGDSRQLPPTTFFQRLDAGDEPPPDELPEDLESVLDECVAAGLPRQHLDWHYRSRHESLIAFSNHHYYQNRLLTFPTPQPVAAGLGVRCVRVDGVYDRAGAQTNRREAEALVAEVVARLRDPARSRHSLGIVTFSRAQQVLIEDLLDQARRAHPELEPHFGDRPEPVFVKNLENVQGDERDAILFSVCYGPDAAGRVHENYGPLNQQGGERRLNVAVTRARRELLVFTSLRAEQVAQRSAALGARHLRAFLDYAERGTAALAAASAAAPGGGVESPFEQAVRDALVQRGHEVHCQIGCAGYRIDLAVVDPAAPGHYLLGIECDGASYHAAATARDRDRLRAAVLQGLGWRLCRVWSTDFWQDPAGQLERLDAAIAAARAARAAAAEAAPAPAAVPPPPPAPAPPPAAAPAGAGPAPADPHGARAFAAAELPRDGDAEAFAAAAPAALRSRLAAVLAAEAPVVEARLFRLVAASYGVARLGERGRQRLRAALPDGAMAVGGAWFAAAPGPDGYRGFRGVDASGAALRDADELPEVEVQNAMRWLLRQHLGLAEDDLCRETARAFGFARLGSALRERTAAALADLLAAGRARRDGGLVRPG